MLHEFLTANREQLVMRCRAKVAKRAAPAPTAIELEHGSPLFLDQLIGALREEPAAPRDDASPGLAEMGVSARGAIGDGDPLQALEDALREFPADEIVVSTHPPGRSHWLEQGVVEQARLRYDVPVTHVVVDLAAAESP